MRPMKRSALLPLVMALFVVAVLGEELPKLQDPALDVAPGDNDRLRAPGIYNFLSFQEFDGRKNLTALYWNPSTQAWFAKTGKLYADVGSTIRVQFDRERLFQADTRDDAGAFFTSGQLSLAARIADRDIEVQGYSEVGKERTTVGATGMPPLRFLRNLEEFQRRLILTQAYKDLFDLSVRQQGDASQLEPHPESAPPLEQLGEFATETHLLADMLTEFQRDPSTARAFFVVLRASPTLVENKLKALQQLLTELDGRLKKAREDDDTEAKKQAEGFATRKAELDAALKEAMEASQKLSRLKKEAAKLTLPGDAEKKQEAEGRATSAEDEFAQADMRYRLLLRAASVAQRPNETAELQRFVVSVYPVIRDLSDSLNGDFRASNTALVNKVLLIRETSLRRSAYEYAQPVGDQAAADADLRTALTAYWELPDSSHTGATGTPAGTRREQVYRQIFQNLVDGQIVLSKTGAKPGEILLIELLFFQAGKDKPVAFTVAEVHIERFGPQVSIVDSFLLVKRFQENKTPANVVSNFRGAAGVSALYANYPRPGAAGSSAFGTWLARTFSVGVNVSYLTFDSSKELEIGLGPILGVWSDRIQIGAGVDLNGSGGLRQRGYYFIGLSFAKLAEKLKGGS